MAQRVLAPGAVAEPPAELLDPRSRGVAIRETTRHSLHRLSLAKTADVVARPGRGLWGFLSEI